MYDHPDDDLAALIGPEAAFEVAASVAGDDNLGAPCDALDTRPEGEPQVEDAEAPLSAGEAMPHLPTTLATIAAVVGEEAALSIAEAHGGTEVHIPVAPQPDHWLSDLIGHPEATAVAAALAMQVGLRVKVPFVSVTSPARADRPDTDGMGSTVLDDIAAVIGTDATFALAAEFRGEILDVPKHYGTNPRVAAAIGVSRAREFCDHYHSTKIPFPSLPIIRRLVVDFAERGITKRGIAQRLSIRQSRVFEILRRHRLAKDEDQAPEG